MSLDQTCSKPTHTLITSAVCTGRGGPAERPPQHHSGVTVRPDLRGAAGVEAAAADRLHRRSAQRLRGPSAELVRFPTTYSTSLKKQQKSKATKIQRAINVKIFSFSLNSSCQPLILLQVHSGSREFAAGPSAPEEAAGVGAEVHLRLRPHHPEEDVPGGPSPRPPQEPSLQVRILLHTVTDHLLMDHQS